MLIPDALLPPLHMNKFVSALHRESVGLKYVSRLFPQAVPDKGQGSCSNRIEVSWSAKNFSRCKERATAHGQLQTGNYVELLENGWNYYNKRIARQPSSCISLKLTLKSRTEEHTRSRESERLNRNTLDSERRCQGMKMCKLAYILIEN